jgi:hypothetical protein
MLNENTADCTNRAAIEKKEEKMCIGMGSIRKTYVKRT